MYKNEMKMERRLKRLFFLLYQGINSMNIHVIFKQMISFKEFRFTTYVIQVFSYQVFFNTASSLLTFLLFWGSFAVRDASFGRWIIGTVHFVFPFDRTEGGSIREGGQGGFDGGGAWHLFIYHMDTAIQDPGKLQQI